MTDTLSPKERSLRMSKIHGTNTKPELLVRRFLFSRGFRYRIHCKNLCGNPDIVLKKYNTLVFINGCFWHGHVDCKTWRIPLSKKQFWTIKIQRNRERDATNLATLKNLGWNVIIVWECELKNKTVAEKRLNDLEFEIRGFPSL